MGAGFRARGWMKQEQIDGNMPAFPHAHGGGEAMRALGELA